ncbi:MAG: CRISPR-associated protein [Rivularia sp. T60_A2020_040]|nr:CRISPR-associated protein [Rivularia sp. T60_A2020_040]
MTQTPKPKLKKPASPQPSSRDNLVANNYSKPYQFVSFPRERPNLGKPAGHDKFDKNRLHGTLFLRLHVQTPLHVSTGIVAPGSDVESRVALIKTMTQGTEKQLLIQGSSLKGCIRSVYEAITRSCLCKTKADIQRIPDGYKECKINIKRNRIFVCDACRIFGALDWQGLIEFNDAKCESIGFNTGFMPSLHRPHPEVRNIYLNSEGEVKGRKFYYHTISAIDKGQNQGIAVQQATKAYTFTTQLQFKNLKPEELGTLLVVLGQDSKYPIALKIGGGKPIGMGTMTVEITQAKVLQNIQDWKQRYCKYTPKNDNLLAAETLKLFIQTQIQTAHSSQLIQSEQLQQLTQILRYPTDREPPEGKY